MSNGALPIELLMDAGGSVADSFDAATAALAAYEVFWSAGDWPGLHRHAEALAGIADSIHLRIAARARLADPVRAGLAAEDRAFRDAWRALAEDGSPVALEAKEALLEALAGQLGGLPQAEAARERLLSGEGPLSERAARFATRIGREESELADLHAALRVLAVRAEYLGLVQQGAALSRADLVALAAEGGGFIPAQGPQPADAGLLSDLGTALLNLVEAGFAQLYAALKADLPVEDFAAIAGGAGDRARLQAGMLSRLLGSYLHLASLDGPPSGKERIAACRAALVAAESVERASLMTAYAAYVRANSVTRGVARWYGNERRRTDRRQFASMVPAGLPVAIPDLAQDPGLPAGDLFQVEGRVETIQILDDPRPPKFSTFVDLADPAGGGAIRVRAHMFSLINNGLAAGAWCALHGRLRRGEPWLAPGQVGLDVHRVPLGELGRESWLDDVTFRMRPWFTIYMNQMNMFFTPSIPLEGD